LFAAEEPGSALRLKGTKSAKYWDFLPLHIRSGLRYPVLDLVLVDEDRDCLN